MTVIGLSALTQSVASVPMGLGGGAAAPPLFERVNKKSDIFIGVYSGIVVNHTEKSRRFSVCPATFFAK